VKEETDQDELLFENFSFQENKNLGEMKNSYREEEEEKMIAPAMSNKNSMSTAKSSSGP